MIANRITFILLHVLVIYNDIACQAFLGPPVLSTTCNKKITINHQQLTSSRRRIRHVSTTITGDSTKSSSLSSSSNSDDEIEWTSDFDGYNIGGNPSSDADEDIRQQQQQQQDDDIDIDDESTKDFNNNLSDFLSTKRSSRDLTGVTIRMFSLGPDVIVNDFVGKMGFDEVVDWQYYYENEDDPSDRKVVNPNPFDSSKPKRTRTSSGSVVRVFRGEFVGRLGGTLNSIGLDRRVLIKEYTGKLGLELARKEQESIGRLQSELFSDDDNAVGGDWIQAATSRSVLARKDDSYVSTLLKKLSKTPFLGILGEVNLAELEDEMDPNDFYRALGVPPPSTDAVWVVYEYAGLNTVASYASMPPEKRRAQQPPKRNFFGQLVEPSPLPPFRERAKYVVNGVMKGAIEALATIHDAGIAHRSIGRSSIIMSSPNQNKQEATSVYATRIGGLSIKLSDFGKSNYDESLLLFENYYCEQAMPHPVTIFL